MEARVTDNPTKLWVDDIRRPPDDTWAWARRNHEALLILQSGEITECSLDHDMGLHEHDPDQPNADEERIPMEHQLEPDGRALVDEMIRRDLVPPKITIHSWNIYCANVMRKTLEAHGHRAICQPFDPDIRA
jgi:hypothetical protein